MAFETKVLDTLSCPRCNGKAEQRIDIIKTDGEFIPVYIVCPICRLKQYTHTTTRKAIKQNARIKKLERLIGDNHPNSKKIQHVLDKLNGKEVQ